MMVNTDKGLIRKWSAGSMYYYKTLLFHRCAILGFKIGAAIAEVQARLDDPVTRQMAAQHSLHPCTTSHFALVELHKRYVKKSCRFEEVLGRDQVILCPLLGVMRSHEGASDHLYT